MRAFNRSRHILESQASMHVLLARPGRSPNPVLRLRYQKTDCLVTMWLEHASYIQERQWLKCYLRSLRWQIQRLCLQ